MTSPIFVFGSNLAGRHGRSAALVANRYFGAELGVGEGLTGSAYALPTKDAALNSLSLPAVMASIERFLAFARHHPELEFEVTRVGCGLAGFQDAQLAPAFLDAPRNCTLPYRWQLMLHRATTPRVIVAYSPRFNNYRLLRERLNHFTASFTGSPAIVVGGERGANTLGERYATRRELEIFRFPADWRRFGRAAGRLCHARMAWAASHLVAFWDGQSAETRNMIETAKADGLAVRIVLFHTPTQGEQHA
ncbi:SLOG family protein [Rhodanobacter sp. 115]|uniref:A1S_2505 family phage non-structural protein n=1 Tax=Rhodanobacter sp. FW021-MT20 TaxID=1162282 RepID=UPI0034E52E98